MELNVLPYGEIGGATRVAFSHRSNGSKLMGSKQAAGNPNADHEVRQSPALTALSADDASAVSLGVNTPPAEVRPDPLWGNRGESFARKTADFVEAFPGI